MGADAVQIRIAQPELQPLPDPGIGLCIAVVDPLAIPVEILAEPVERLPAQKGTFFVVQLVRVLALTATRQCRRAGGKVAGGRQHVFGQLGRCREGVRVQSCGGAPQALELTARNLAREQGQALVIALRFVFAAPEGRQFWEDDPLGLPAEHMADPCTLVG